MAEIYVKCWDCGYEWRIRPNRWENWSLIKRGKKVFKLLSCPDCQAKNEIDMSKIAKQLKRGERRGTSKSVSSKRRRRLAKKVRKRK